MVNNFISRNITAAWCFTSTRIFVSDVFIQTGEILLHKSLEIIDATGYTQNAFLPETRQSNHFQPPRNRMVVYIRSHYLRQYTRY